jgi:hypothetical protein
MLAFVLVTLGSAVGGLCRYLVAVLLTPRLTGSWPLGTLLVNVLGCFVLSLVNETVLRGLPLRPSLRLLADDRLLWRLYHLFHLQLRDGQPGRAARPLFGPGLCCHHPFAVSVRPCPGGLDRPVAATCLASRSDLPSGRSDLPSQLPSGQRGMVPHDRPSTLRSVVPSAESSPSGALRRLKSPKRRRKTSV